MFYDLTLLQDHLSLLQITALLLSIPASVLGIVASWMGIRSLAMARNSAETDRVPGVGISPGFQGAVPRSHCACQRGGPRHRRGLSQSWMPRVNQADATPVAG